MADGEPVLELGVEGGGATVVRTPSGAGGWQFHVEGASMSLDEIDGEDWRPSASSRVATVEDALRAVAADGTWVLSYPLTVHPDYRATVWELARQAARSLPEHLAAVWERRRPVWERLCGPGAGLNDNDVVPAAE